MYPYASNASQQQRVEHFQRAYKHELSLCWWCLRQTGSSVIARIRSPREGWAEKLPWRKTQSYCAEVLGKQADLTKKVPQSLLDSPSLQCPWLPQHIFLWDGLKTSCPRTQASYQSKEAFDQRKNGKCKWYFASLGTFVSVFLAGFHKHFFIQGYKVTSSWCVCGHSGWRLHLWC